MKQASLLVHSAIRHDAHVVANAAAELRARLPEQVYLGTADWRFPHWAGEVYDQERSAADLWRDGLVEYTAHPLFSTLLLPAPENVIDLQRDLRMVEAQLPAGFPCWVEAPPMFVAPRLHGHANPNFLDGDELLRRVVRPCAGVLGERFAGLVLSFANLRRAGLTTQAFAVRLEMLLEELAPHTLVAVELLDPNFLCMSYAHALAAGSATHVLTAAPYVASLEEQAQAVPTGAVAFVRVRAPESVNAVARGVAPLPKQPAFVVVEDAGVGGAPAYMRALAEALAVP